MENSSTGLAVLDLAAEKLVRRNRDLHCKEKNLCVAIVIIVVNAMPIQYLLYQLLFCAHLSSSLTRVLVSVVFPSISDVAVDFNSFIS